MALGQVLFSTSVFSSQHHCINDPYTFLLHVALARRTNGRSPVNLEKEPAFGSRGALDRNALSLSYRVGKHRCLFTETHKYTLLAERRISEC